MKVKLTFIAETDEEKRFLHQLFQCGLLGEAVNTDQRSDRCELITVELPSREGFLG
jgi:hypothetical protein